MPKAELRIAQEFVEDLSRVYSERVLDQMRAVLTGLAEYPEMGSPDVRPALVARYGPNIRKVPVSTLVVVYRYDGAHVDVLALVYGPSIS